MSPHMATTTLRVDGMTCGACTSAVEGAFKDVVGAGNVSVSLVMSRAVVQHDPEQLAPEKIKDLIEDRGFDADLLSTDTPVPSNTHGAALSTTTLAVEGMTCGACTSAVEAGFNTVAGVKSMSVSLLSERAVVEHDPSIISPEALADIIEDRGFDARIIETVTSPSGPPPYSRESHVDANRPDLWTTTVSIEGMTCGACTSAVEGGFQDCAGLVQFNISLLAERAVLVHDPQKLPSEKLVEIIEDRGFDAHVLSSHKAEAGAPSSQTLQLKIFGLLDQSMVTQLEGNLLSLPGIKAAVIALPTSRCSITHNPSQIGVRAIIESIEKSGFNALLADLDDSNAQLESLAKTREIQEWRRAWMLSASLAIPVFLISMLIPMTIPALDFGSWNLLIPGLYLGDVICLLLTVPVQFGIGRRFYASAFKSLKHGSPTMDVLVVLGTSAAFFFSCAAMIVSILIPPHTRPNTVFETSSMLITFISLGRFLENRAKGSTSKALSRLMSLAPSMATIYADPLAAEKAAETWTDGVSEKPMTGDSKVSEEKVIPTELIEVGDVVILRPGDKIPADGIVIRGQSYVEESMVTGEAMPILKGKGSTLLAGTVNNAGVLSFRVTRAGRDTQLSQIVRLVQEAQTSRAPIQRMADRLAGKFVPTIITLGVITFVGWMALSHILANPPMIFLQPESGGRFMVCLKLCISVIVFACPCALGLSTPTAVMVGTGVGAEHGILVKGGAVLETATRVSHVVFDKTGTLTMGKMSVADAKLEDMWTSNDWRRRLWWTLVGLAEMNSEHPIGKAVVAAAKDELRLGPEDAIDGSVGDFEVSVGQGLTAYIEPASSFERKRYKLTIGNAAFLGSQNITVPHDTLSSTTGTSASTSPSSSPSSITQIYTAIDSTFAGLLSLSDSLKPSAAATITALSRMGITASLITGDQLPTALSVAQSVGIPSSNVHACASPTQKQEFIKTLLASSPSSSGSHQTPKIAMVGDGINDSPALATASVGIALSSGTDVAMEAADIVLMRPDDLLAVPASLHLSRTIFNRIKLNLGWACVYNIVGLPFAMGVGLLLPGHFMMPPMMAGGAMALSSVSVVGSSLLLKLWRRPRWMTVEKLDNLPRKAVTGDGTEMATEMGLGRGTVPTGRFRFSSLAGPWRRITGRRKRNEDREDIRYVPLQDVETV